MPSPKGSAELTEEQLAEQIDALAADKHGSAKLAALLREDNPVYEQRSAAAVVRLRGWILLAVARAGVQEDTLLFVLEELDTGLDAYLVAAAARALRSYPWVNSAFAPLVVRALTNIIGHDNPVSFEHYGEYSLSVAGSTSPVRELLKTLKWLGPAARDVLPLIKAARTHAFPARLLRELDQTIEAVDTEPARNNSCCELAGGLPRVVAWSCLTLPFSIGRIAFEDQDGAPVGFDDIVAGHPTIVVFFYTRCDNPLKCSLTITKLGRVQKLLEERGLGGRIHTAAITYDPAFDLPDRMRAFGSRRGVSFNNGNLMLRTVKGMGSLRRRFRLGVNFTGAVVNRHRIEAYILDDRGRIVYSFERLLWNEGELVDRAVTLLDASPKEAHDRPVSTTVGAAAAIGFALFPKCPVCWAAYLSILGIAGLERIPYSPWIEPALAGVALINLVSVWVRARATDHRLGAWLVTVGVSLIGASRLGWPLAGCGIATTLAGSVVSVLATRARFTPTMGYHKSVVSANPH